MPLVPGQPRDIAKVIIAGSRTFDDYEMLKREFIDWFLGDSVEIQIICGMARGADLLGKRFAEERGWKVIEMPAQWDKYGRSAGYKRNEAMADIANACICFWDGESRGTKHMIDICERQKIACKIVKFNKRISYAVP